MDTLSYFSARFNAAVNARSKSFNVSRSQTVRSILTLFYKNGYIFSYTSAKDCYVVFLNHKAISFKLERCSKSSNKFTYTLPILKASSNRGSYYLIRTFCGYQFSDSARINRLSGYPVYRLKFFA